MRACDFKKRKNHSHRKHENSGKNSEYTMECTEYDVFLFRTLGPSAGHRPGVLDAHVRTVLSGDRWEFVYMREGLYGGTGSCAYSWARIVMGWAVLAWLSNPCRSHIAAGRPFCRGRPRWN